MRNIFKIKVVLLIIVLISCFSMNSVAQDIDTEMDYIDSINESESTEPNENSYISEEPEVEKTQENQIVKEKSVDYSNPLAEGQIVVEKFKDNTAPYSERRSRFGFLFNINYEQFSPNKYYSLIHSLTYGELAGGASIPLMGIEAGIKYNFSLGSLSALLGYSLGEMSDETVGIDKMSMAVTKAALNYSIDNIFLEPYVVPFVQAGVHIIDWTEVGTVGADTKEENITSQPTLHVKAGLSFQLNWIEGKIDPSTHEDGLRSSGLENTFLDLYYTKYFEPNGVSEQVAESEANFESSEVGLGLKLEF